MEKVAAVMLAKPEVINVSKKAKTAGGMNGFEGTNKFG